MESRYNCLWYNPTTNPEDLIGLSELKEIKAIQNQQVFELPSVFLCDLWTLKFSFAIKMIAKWCYPEIFANVNLKEEKRKMLIQFYGKRGLNLIQ